MPPPSDDPTYQRIVRVIRGAIRASNRSQIELDRLIGRKDGYLSHVFHGRVQFKVRDLVGVVRALDLDPAAVFGYLVVDQAGATRRGRPEAGGGGPAGGGRTPSGQASPGELARLIAALLDGPDPSDPRQPPAPAEPEPPEEPPPADPEAPPVDPEAPGPGPGDRGDPPE